MSNLDFLEEALKVIAVEDKKDFIEAKSLAPKIVEAESNPLHFLAAEKLNVWNAARRICKHWKWRKQLFQERALLPLFDLSGKGAMDSEDIALVEKGLMVLLPQDKEGNSVIFETSRLSPDCPNLEPNRKFRPVFYIFCQACQEQLRKPKQQIQQIILLSYVGENSSFPGQGRILAQLLDEALPIPCKAICGLFLAKEESSKERILKLVAPTFLQNWGTFLKGSDIELLQIFGNSEAELLGRLEILGMRKKDMPELIGGSWSYEIFNRWLNEKKQSPASSLNRLRPTSEEHKQRPAAKRCKISSQQRNGDFQLGSSDNSRHSRSQVATKEPRNHFLQSAQLTKLLAESLTNKMQVDHSAKNSVAAEYDTERSRSADDSPEKHSTIASPTQMKGLQGGELTHFRQNSSSQCNAGNTQTVYDQIRGKVFAERATLPMNQIGSGTLTDMDIEALDKGFLMVLPRNQDGHCVLAYDVSLAEQCSFETQRRCFFYMLSVISAELSIDAAGARESASASAGPCQLCQLSILFSIGESNSNTFNGDETFSDILKAFPSINLAAVHVFMECVGMGWYSYQESIRSATNKLFESTKDTSFFHTLQSLPEVRKTLKLYGFRQEDLPECLGGGFTRERFLQWKRKVVSHEAGARDMLTRVDDRSCGEIAQVNVSSWTLATPANNIATKPFDPRLEDQKADTIPTNGSSLMNRIPNSSCLKPEQAMRMKICLMDDAIKAIPMDEKTQYLEAMAVAPHLFATESNPMSFLRAENFNAWNAALRLVKYWKWRKDFFGDRAFLPILDLTGKGALNDEDIRVLGRCPLVLLPQDKEGNSVLFNQSRLDPEFAGWSITQGCRLNFFWISLACEEQLHKHGTMGGLCVLSWIGGDTRAFQFYKPLTVLLKEVLPIQFKALYGVFLMNEAATALDILQSAAPSFLGNWCNLLSETSSVVRVFGYSEAEILGKLEILGMKREGLPSMVGGKWSFDVFYRFFRMKTQSNSRHLTNSVAITGGEECSVECQKSPFLASPYGSNESRKDYHDEAFDVDNNQAEILDLGKSSVVGNANTISETPGKESLRLLEEVIRQMPLEVKIDYLLATQMGRSAFERESHPIRFLRCENFNALGAAERIIKYWTCRKKVFGERAFLPLKDLSGNGAMDKEDISLLRRGLIVLLPRDKHGNSVIYDRSSEDQDWGRNVDYIKKLRLFFFIISLACDEQHSKRDQPRAMKILSLMSEDSNCTPDLSFSLVFREGMPLECESIFCLFLAKKESNLSSFFETVGGWNQVFRNHSTSVVPVAAESTHGFLQKLNAVGMSDDRLPSTIGGSWSFDNFNTWMNSRTQSICDEVNNKNSSHSRKTYFCQANELGDSMDVKTDVTTSQQARKEVDSLPPAEVHPCRFSDGQSGSKATPQFTNYLSFKTANLFPPTPQPSLSNANRASGIITSAQDEEFVRSQVNLMDTVIESISFEEKKHYLDAVSLAPHLFENESSPLNFLRVEKFDASAAASRLVKYWHWRRTIFGNRAFLPLMDLTGNGALNGADIEMLGRGVFFILPQDKDGNSVMFGRANHNVSYASLDLNAKLRLFFFVASLACEEQLSKSKGMGGLVVVSWLKQNSKVEGYLKCFAALVREALPIKSKALYGVFLMKEVSAATAILQSVAPVFLGSWCDWLSGTDTSLIRVFGNSESELVKKLEILGMKKEGLPTFVGGSWNVENFYNWLKYRRSAKAPPRLPANDLCSGAAGNISASKQKPSRVLEITKEENEDALENSERGNVLLQTNVLRKIHLEHSNSSKILENHPAFFDEPDSSGGALPIKSKTSFNTRQTPQDEQEDEKKMPSTTNDQKSNIKKQNEPLDEGFLMNLPTSEDGHHVLAYDVSLAVQCNFETQRRCFFCMLSALSAVRKWDAEVSSESASAAAPQCRLSILFFIGESSSNTLNGDETFSDILRAFPSIHLAAVHVFMECVGMGWYSYQESIRSATNRLFDSNKETTFFHTLQSLPEVRKTLKLYGFRQEDLPECLGGGFTRERFLQWKRKVVGHEAGARDMLTRVDNIEDTAQLSASSRTMLTPPNHLALKTYERKSEGQMADNVLRKEGLMQNSIPNSPASQPDQAMRMKICLMDDAIRAIPIDEKTQYLEAMAVAPHLFATESNPMGFLRAENFNAWNAALRLVKYWKWRKDIFGDRAFLPILDLTGKGALTTELIEMIERYPFVLLPQDKEGNSVMFNRCRVVPEYMKLHPQKKLSIFFFMFSLACDEQQEKAGRMGRLSAISWMSGDKSFGEHIRKIVLLAKDVMLLQFNKIYGVFLMKQEDTAFASLQSAVPNFVGNWCNVLNNLPSSQVVFGFSEAEIGGKLVRLGLEREKLPSMVGGTWSFDNFHKLLERKKLRWGKPH